MKIKSPLLAIFILPLIVAINPKRAHAQAQWTKGNCVVDVDVATIQGVECLVRNVLIVAIQLIGILMLVMLIAGGFKYLTAQGDPKAIESAKGTITSALIGLIIAICSWMILLLISQFTGVDKILDFSAIYSGP